MPGACHIPTIGLKEFRVYSCLNLFIVQELYTGSSDRQILVWSPPKHVPVEDEVSHHMISCQFRMFN